MIITCVCGEKKFNLPDGSIPASGRLVQCGFCEKKWTQYDFMKFVKRKVAFYAFLIRIPSFVLKLIFGGRSVIVEGGCSLSVNKLLATNFEYCHPNLESAINKEIYKK